MCVVICIEQNKLLFGNLIFNSTLMSFFWRSCPAWAGQLRCHLSTTHTEHQTRTIYKPTSEVCILTELEIEPNFNALFADVYLIIHVFQTLLFFNKPESSFIQIKVVLERDCRAYRYQIGQFAHQNLRFRMNGYTRYRFTRHRRWRNHLRNNNEYRLKLWTNNLFMEIKPRLEKLICELLI